MPSVANERTTPDPSARSGGSPIRRPPLTVVESDPPPAARKIAVPSSDSVFLTPRVIDQNRIEQLISAMRELVEAARDEAASLQTAVTQTESRTADASRLAGQLQERLSLGARMLKAFQSQIERVGQALEEMREREENVAAAQSALDEKVGAFDGRIQSQLEAFEKRLDDLSERAAERYQHRVEEQAPAVRELIECIAQGNGRLDGTAKRIEAVEQSVTAIENEHQGLARAFDESLAEMRATFERADRTRLLLHDDLKAAERDAADLREEAAALEQRNHDMLATCHSRAEELERLREGLGAAIDEELQRSASLFRSLADRTEALRAGEQGTSSLSSSR